MRRSLVLASISSVLAAACAAAPERPPVQITHAVVPEAPPPEAAPPPPEPEPLVLPETCGEQGPRKVCTPDAEVAKRLCSADQPDAALTLFAKGTPFSRAYMTREVDGWNAAGGRTHQAKLQFDEEVLVMAYRKANANGIIMVTKNGDTGTYDVMRWDGSCVSVTADEISTNRPPQPKRAPILWKRLEEPTKAALLGEPKIKASFEARDKSCDGTDEAKCSKAEGSFNASIVDFVRAGGSLPKPLRTH